MMLDELAAVLAAAPEAASRADYAAAIVEGNCLGKAITEDSVVALFGVGALFGFARLSHILAMVESDMKGRLVVFFPGHLERSNYPRCPRWLELHGRADHAARGLKECD